MSHCQLQQTCYATRDIHPWKYVLRLRFDTFCFGMVAMNFTHIRQGYFTGTWITNVSEAALQEMGHVHRYHPKTKCNEAVCLDIRTDNMTSTSKAKHMRVHNLRDITQNQLELSSVGSVLIEFDLKCLKMR